MSEPLELCVNIEIQCERNYARSWISKSVSVLEDEHGIILRIKNLRECTGTVEIDEQSFEYAWVSEGYDRWGSVDKGLVITYKTNDYWERMDTLFPILNTMKKLYDVIKATTEERVLFYASTCGYFD